MSSPTVVPTTTITPPPRFRARQTSDPPIWGFFYQGTTISTLFCATDEIFTSSHNDIVTQKIFAGCYGTDYLASSNPMRTACIQVSTGDDTLPSETIQCTMTTASCITQTIYASSPGDPPMSDIFCAIGEDWKARTIFRTITAAEPTSSSSITSTSSLSSTSSTSSQTSTSSSSTLTPTTSTATLATTPASKSSGSSPQSQAWIAGPVLGCVALLAFIGFALWYIRNQQRKRKEAAAAANEHRMSYNPSAEYPLYSGTPKPLSPTTAREGAFSGGEMYVPVPMGSPGTSPHTSPSGYYQEDQHIQQQGRGRHELEGERNGR